MNTIICVLMVAFAVSTCTQAFSLSHSFRCQIFCHERYRSCLRDECDDFTSEIDQYYLQYDCAEKCRALHHGCPRSCGITRRGK